MLKILFLSTPDLKYARVFYVGYGRVVCKNLALNFADSMNSYIVLKMGRAQ